MGIGLSLFTESGTLAVNAYPGVTPSFQRKHPKYPALRTSREMSSSSARIVSSIPDELS